MKKWNSDNILSVNSQEIGEVLLMLAQRVRQRRLEMNFTQKAFSARAGVCLPTYRRFENIGEISLRNLVLIAQTLKMTEDFNLLFSKPVYQSLDAMLNAKNSKLRKRGSLNE